MKKNLRIAIIFMLVIVMSMLLYLRMHKTSALETAEQFERAGDLQRALSLYTEAVFNLSPSQPLPDIYRSKFLTPDVLKKEVMKYISWLYASPAPRHAELSKAYEGMQRCMKYGKSDISLTDPQSQEFTREKYLSAWNITFFAPGARIDPSHDALASGNLSRNLSLIIISCGKNYSYELKLMNSATLQSTTCRLPSENSVRLYAQPGEHFLLVRSTATFSPGKIWISQVTPLRIVIPEKASEITMELRTSISRK